MQEDKSRGIVKQPTNQLVVVAGPDDKRRHRFIRIYPGQECPDLKYKNFWDEHAFIAAP